MNIDKLKGKIKPKGKNDYKIFNKLTNFQDLEGQLHAIFIHFIF